MKKGCDVSEWQVIGDYTPFKCLDFVILREGYRKTIDKQFLTHVSGFRSVNVELMAIQVNIGVGSVFICETVHVSVSAKHDHRVSRYGKIDLLCLIFGIDGAEEPASVFKSEIKSGYAVNDDVSFYPLIGKSRCHMSSVGTF